MRCTHPPHLLAALPSGLPASSLSNSAGFLAFPPSSSIPNHVWRFDKRRHAARDGRRDSLGCSTAARPFSDWRAALRTHSKAWVDHNRAQISLAWASLSTWIEVRGQHYASAQMTLVHTPKSKHTRTASTSLLTSCGARACARARTHTHAQAGALESAMLTTH